MTSLYLEHYLESVESLPSDLQRNFTLMRELDIQAQGEAAKLEARCNAFLEEMGTMTVEERRTRLAKIQGGFKNALGLGDQKVTLAVQSYETIDKHIRQLDSDLSRFEAENAEETLRTGTKRRLDQGGSCSKRGKRNDMTDDMPVDPNEPTYCLCHQVSYGEMIGCDNPDCPTEWFHFACVQLKSQPKGKWYCPRCQAENERKSSVQRRR